MSAQIFVLSSQLMKIKLIVLNKLFRKIYMSKYAMLYTNWTYNSRLLTLKNIHVCPSISSWNKTMFMWKLICKYLHFFVKFKRHQKRCDLYALDVLKCSSLNWLTYPVGISITYSSYLLKFIAVKLTWVLKTLSD